MSVARIQPFFPKEKTSSMERHKNALTKVLAVKDDGPSFYNPGGLSDKDPRVQLINTALRKSGVFAEYFDTMYVPPASGNGLQWMEYQRLFQALLLVADKFINDPTGNPHTRRYGPQITELVHLIWCVHSVFNNKNIRASMKAAGLSMETACIAAALHDLPEAMRDTAKTATQNFDPKTLFDEIVQCVGVFKPVERLVIHYVVFNYMTDSDPAQKGLARSLAQALKPTRPHLPEIYGNPIPAESIADAIQILCEGLRGCDKTHHSLSDAYWRRQYLAAVKRGLVSANDNIEKQRFYGLCDADLLDAIKQSKMKQYAVERPGVSQYDRDRYMAEQLYLIREYTRVNAPIAKLSLMLNKQVYQRLAPTFTVAANATRHTLKRAFGWRKATIGQ